MHEYKSGIFRLGFVSDDLVFAAGTGSGTGELPLSKKKSIAACSFHLADSKYSVACWLEHCVIAINLLRISSLFVDDI
jgi:hypothetical protein